MSPTQRPSENPPARRETERRLPPPGEPALPGEDKPVDQRDFETFPLEQPEDKTRHRRDDATRKDLNVSDGGLSSPPFHREGPHRTKKPHTS